MPFSWLVFSECLADTHIMVSDWFVKHCEIETPASGEGEVMCAGDDSAPNRALGSRPSPSDDPFLLSCVRDGWLHRREAGVMQGAGRGRCMTLGGTVTLTQEKDVCHKVKNSVSLSSDLFLLTLHPPQDREAGPESLTATVITTAPRGLRVRSPAPQAVTAGNPLPEAPPHPGICPESV